MTKIDKMIYSIDPMSGELLFTENIKSQQTGVRVSIPKHTDPLIVMTQDGELEPYDAHRTKGERRTR